MSVLPFRTFKVKDVVESAFFTNTSEKNKEFAQADLARSGLTLEDMNVVAPPMLRLPEKALAGYVIPYFNLKGEPIVDADQNLVMFRTRVELPPFSRDSRYVQPSAEQLQRHGLPGFLPYIRPETFRDGDRIYCCEGEKKTAAVIKYLGVPAFGIGGCQMWRDPSGSGSLHPWIRSLLDAKGRPRVVIVPDGDVLRYDICNAYGTFAATLIAEGYEVEIIHSTGKIDDLLVVWGNDAEARVANLPRIDPQNLVQSPSSLCKRYNLAFREAANGQIVVHQHTANITKLMREHPAFPKIWRNTDTNIVYLGDKACRPEHSEMEIANYFQHNLGMSTVGSKQILSVMQYLARENERSPMLEWIKEQEWDGRERLNSWISRHWKIERHTNYIAQVAARWLISACARMDKPGSKVDWMPIVIGPQGTGKTSMPNIIFKGHSLTLYGEHNDKDLHMLMHSSLCVGFDELDSFGKRETSNLKAMVTRTEDAFRPPYGASVDVFPRRFTLYGCGNRQEFLQYDPSGYRRYAIIEVKKLLDFAGLEAEVPQLWAEAWHRYKQGETYWEIDDANAVAQNYAVQSTYAESIDWVIQGWAADKHSNKVKDGQIWFTMRDLLTQMGLETKHNPAVTRDVGGILRSMGAELRITTGPAGIKARWYIMQIP